MKGLRESISCFLGIAALIAHLTTQCYGSGAGAGDGDGDGRPFGAPVTSRLPVEVLSGSNTFVLASAERAAQGIAGFFLDKEQEIKARIAGLAIGDLEAAYTEKLAEARTLADVDDSFTLTGGLPENPSDSVALLGLIQEAQRKKNLFEIACLKKDILEREAKEAKDLSAFFSGSTLPLSVLIETKDTLIPGHLLAPIPPRVPVHHGWAAPQPQPPLEPAEDRPLIDFIAGVRNDVVFFRVENFERKCLPPRADVNGINLLVGNLNARVFSLQSEINKWFESFPKIYDLTLKGLEQVHIQQSTAIGMFGPELGSLDAKTILEHRNKLSSLAKIEQEKQAVINVMNTFKDFIDSMRDYLRKNSRET
jgi:hypothetical protein